jgi:hypothetical protein
MLTLARNGHVLMDCETCGDTGVLGSDGWFKCPAPHRWRSQCSRQGCGATLRRRGDAVRCKADHAQS